MSATGGNATCLGQRTTRGISRSSARTWYIIKRLRGFPQLTTFFVIAGKNLSVAVIRDISAMIHNCLPVSKVVTFLYQRNVLSYDDYEDLGKDPPSAGIKLSRALVKSSKRSVGEGKDLIKNLYLALLDAFLDTHNSGCHHLALHLRQTGIHM